MAQIDVRPDVMPDPSRTLRFEGTVEVGGSLTGEMLNVLFGQDSDVNGKLHFQGAVQIDGTFRGAITTNDLLIVGERAKINADITCGSAVVKGEVTGNITASESVTLQGRARVKGDISTPELGMEKGVVFDGVSRMGTLPAAKVKRRPNGGPGLPPLPTRP